MARRRFEHLVVELSVAIDCAVPRYALWLRLHELGWSPESLTRDAALAFCERHLVGFLSEHGHRLSTRRSRRLQRAVAHFDAHHPTPYETLERLGATD